jgi:hypothetical protein
VYPRESGSRAYPVAKVSRLSSQGRSLSCWAGNAAVTGEKRGALDDPIQAFRA